MTDIARDWLVVSQGDSEPLHYVSWPHTDTYTTSLQRSERGKKYARLILGLEVVSVCVCVCVCVRMFFFFFNIIIILLLSVRGGINNIRVTC